MANASLVWYLLLLLPLHLWIARRRPRREAEPAAGSVVMSLGIFGLAALQHLPLPLLDAWA